MMHKPDNRQGGRINYVTIILLLVFAVFIVASIYIFPKYYKNYALKQKLYSLMVKADIMSDREIESAIIADLTESGVPMAATEIQCYREAGKKIFCKYEFEWPAGIPGLENFKLKFSETVERDITKVQDRLSKP